MSRVKGVKVFSATLAKDREHLGEKVTEWISKRNPEIVDMAVRQSSDAEFHCLSIIVFFA